MKLCMKIVLILSIMVSLPLLAYSSLFYNFGVEEIPMMIAGFDTNSNRGNFTTFANIANLTVSLNLSDDVALKFRLKDYYFYGKPDWNTNIWNSTNSVYIDRLNFAYRSDDISVIAGRDNFVENNGLIIGNLSDGLEVKTGFLQFKQRFYALYSGLMYPKAYNQYSFGLFDTETANSNGPSRMVLGVALEKFGFLIDSFSGSFIYEKDLSSNNYFSPMYLTLSAKDSLLAGLSLNGTFSYEMGNYYSNIGIAAMAGDFGLIYSINSPEITMNATVSMASGDATNTINTVEAFYAFGKYPLTGSVVAPKFSNLFMFNLGGNIKLLNGKLKLEADYRYLMRLSKEDSVEGTYDGTGAEVGNDFSGLANYDLDPNLSLFVTGGYFVRGKAYISTQNVYKAICGASIRL